MLFTLYFNSTNWDVVLYPSIDILNTKVSFLIGFNGSSGFSTSNSVYTAYTYNYPDDNAALANNNLVLAIVE